MATNTNMLFAPVMREIQRAFATTDSIKIPFDLSPYSALNQAPEGVKYEYCLRLVQQANNVSIFDYQNIPIPENWSKKTDGNIYIPINEETLAWEEIILDANITSFLLGYYKAQLRLYYSNDAEVENLKNQIAEKEVELQAAKVSKDTNQQIQAEKTKEKEQLTIIQADLEAIYNILADPLLPAEPTINAVMNEIYNRAVPELFTIIENRHIELKQDLDDQARALENISAIQAFLLELKENGVNVTINQSLLLTAPHIFDTVKKHFPNVVTQITNEDQTITEIINEEEIANVKNNLLLYELSVNNFTNHEKIFNVTFHSHSDFHYLKDNQLDNIKNILDTDYPQRIENIEEELEIIATDIQTAQNNIITLNDEIDKLEQSIYVERQYSEWSIPMIIKVIEKPEIVIANNTTVTTQTPLFQGQCVSPTDMEDQYQFELYQGDVLLEASGWLQHNVNVNNQYEDLTDKTEEMIYTSDTHRFLIGLEDKNTYTIKYSVRTASGYEVSTTQDVTVALPDTTAINGLTISHINQENWGDIGGITLKIVNGSDENYTFVLSRSSEITPNYWEDIQFFDLSVNQMFEYTDMTVESDIGYTYAVQVLYQDGNRSAQVKTSEKLFVSLEHIFLVEDNIVLPIKYNPKISSFKYTTLAQKQDVLGSKYPMVNRNAEANYAEFTFTGTITFNMDEFETFCEKLYDGEEYYNRDHTANNIYLERRFRKKVMEFLNNGKYKLFKSAQEGNIVVTLINVSFTPNAQLSRMVYDFSATAYEVADNNLNTLKDLGILITNDDIMASKELPAQPNQEHLAGSVEFINETTTVSDTPIDLFTLIPGYTPESDIYLTSFEVITNPNASLTFATSVGETTSVLVGETGVYIIDLTGMNKYITGLTVTNATLAHSTFKFNGVREVQS